MKKQVKSRKRVSEHGEVFTNEREINAMLDLTYQETQRIDSRFLEPACGDGNFLIEILKRKLKVAGQKYKRSTYDYERFVLLALGSIYGVELLEDNAIACRQRLFNYWHKEYKSKVKDEYSEETVSSAKFILKKNIVCGNALSLKCVDENGQDTDIPIVFSEWTFPFNDGRMQRKDYTLDELLNDKRENGKTEEVNEEGRFLRQYIMHYRRLNEGEDNK